MRTPLPIVLRSSLAASALLVGGITVGGTALGAAPAMAATAPTGQEALPPRISAVLESGKGCVKPSTRLVKIASAAQKILQPGRAWQLSQGSGVTVAVLDSGVDRSASPQLAGQISLGPEEVTPGATGQDCLGHGTFVAGLIAARPRAGTTIVGIAPQAHIYAVGVTDRTGATSPDVLGRGIVAAVNAGVRIIDVSVVSPSSSPGLVRAVSYAVSHEVLVVAPAAADDQTISGPVYPAALPGVLAVANSSTDTTTSAVGAGSADLESPGDAVLSVGPGGGAFVGSGAAYSAAFVAGTAALVHSYRPSLTLAQLTHRLLVTAYPYGGASTGVAGAGLIDPTAAISTVLPEEYVTARASSRPAPQLQPVTADGAGRAVRVGFLVAAIGVAVALIALAGIAIKHGNSLLKNGIGA